MKNVKFLLIIVSCFLCAGLIGCSSSKGDSGEVDNDKAFEKFESDVETEQKLNGEWHASQSFYEDGFEGIAHGNIVYNADSHEFTANFKMYLEGLYFCSFKFNGKWKASKDEIFELPDFRNSEIEIGSTFKEDVSESEIKQDLISEYTHNSKSKIVSITNSMMVLLDDGEKVEFYRVN